MRKPSRGEPERPTHTLRNGENPARGEGPGKMITQVRRHRDVFVAAAADQTSLGVGSCRLKLRSGSADRLSDEGATIGGSADIFRGCVS